LDEKTQQLEAANQTLRHMSMVDGLTHVANRRRFDETFTEEWNRAVRHHMAVAQKVNQTRLDVLSIILLDIDYFKQYNDTYGHLAGDECLRQVAQAIESCLNRSSDLVARYGGEEFVVLLPATYPDGAINVAENIRQSIEELRINHAASPISSYVTASLGVAGMHVDLDHNEASSLLKRADQALYEAKRRGRNRVIFWDQEHHLADAPTNAPIWNIR
jgi:diguanylate cyclase (GGDEF)-like protein